MLMKPTRAGGESVDGLLGGPPFPARSEAISQEIEPSGGFADKALVRMDAEPQRREHRVHTIDANTTWSAGVDSEPFAAASGTGNYSNTQVGDFTLASRAN
ncbi:hypothetical protein [Thiorhodovibrio frisius]|uniref:hypothetical protein n=1 Tax=Thiorhodovibrio frisius TaxID=631362 RepID=UPI00167F8ABC|nr:hypothetical protein [Thiorhodovibrio frisius]